MSSGNVVMSDKTMYPCAGLYADERDGFISWLRGKFAAATAIIDSLCCHLKNVGEGGEYDEVIGCIQRRRCNWNPVLHMQRYISVAEVLYALKQVTWRRCQRQNRGRCKRSGGVGFRQSQSLKNGILKCDEKDVSFVKCNNVCSDLHLKRDSHSTHIARLKPNVLAVAKTLVGSEMLDGEQISAVEGMKLYEDLFDDSEVGKMVSLVNDLRVSGRQRKFQG